MQLVRQQTSVGWPPPSSQPNRERLFSRGTQAGVLQLNVWPLTVAVNRRLPNDSRRRASSDFSPAGWVGLVELVLAALAEITLSKYSSGRLAAADLSLDMSINVR